MKTGFSRFRREENGQAIVEFALFFSVFFILFGGMVDLCVFVGQGMELAAAAQAGAAYGTIPGNSADISGMTFAATQAAPFIGGIQVSASDIYSCSPGGTTVSSSTTCTDGGPPMKFVQVSASSTVPTLIHITGIARSSTLTSYATYEVPWS
jgi:Flp pilus assembly protein TadG